MIIAVLVLVLLASSVTLVGLFVNRNYRLIAAVLVAFLVAISATFAGLFFSRDRRLVPDCHPDLCEDYYVAGWPWHWKTNAPDRSFKRHVNNDNPFAYDNTGFSLGYFLITIALWFTVVSFIEWLLVAAARFLMRRRAPPAG